MSLVERLLGRWRARRAASPSPWFRSALAATADTRRRLAELDRAVDGYQQAATPERANVYLVTALLAVGQAEQARARARDVLSRGRP